MKGRGATRRRIMDMGITRGAEIYVRKVAPLGVGSKITVRGYELSLRKADAEMIQADWFRLKPKVSIFGSNWAKNFFKQIIR